MHKFGLTKYRYLFTLDYWKIHEFFKCLSGQIQMYLKHKRYLWWLISIKTTRHRKSQSCIKISFVNFKFTFTHTFEVWTCYASSSDLKRLPSPFVRHRSYYLKYNVCDLSIHVTWFNYNTCINLVLLNIDIYLPWITER
jgi:hypothetical protein